MEGIAVVAVAGLEDKIAGVVKVLQGIVLCHRRKMWEKVELDVTAGFEDRMVVVAVVVVVVIVAERTGWDMGCSLNQLFPVLIMGMKEVSLS